MRQGRVIDVQGRAQSGVGSGGAHVPEDQRRHQHRRPRPATPMAQRSNAGTVAAEPTDAAGGGLGKIVLLQGMTGLSIHGVFLVLLRSDLQAGPYGWRHCDCNPISLSARQERASTGVGGGHGTIEQPFLTLSQGWGGPQGADALDGAIQHRMLLGGAHPLSISDSTKSVTGRPRDPGFPDNCIGNGDGDLHGRRFSFPVHRRPGEIQQGPQARRSSPRRQVKRWDEWRIATADA